MLSVTLAGAMKQEAALSKAGNEQHGGTCQLPEAVCLAECTVSAGVIKTVRVWRKILTKQSNGMKKPQKKAMPHPNATLVSAMKKAKVWKKTSTKPLNCISRLRNRASGMQSVISHTATSMVSVWRRTPTAESIFIWRQRERALDAHFAI